MVKYMIAIDGSEGAQRAFDISVKLAKPKDSVYLITVVSQGADSQRLKDDANNLLMKYEQQCSELGLQHQGVILESADPREGIINMVDQYSIDILVVGTRGLSKIQRMFMGSVSAYCVQTAPCDVLVAK